MSSKAGGRKKKDVEDGNIISNNRKAFHDYEIIDKFEAGIILTGSEVKSLRVNQASIKEAYAGPMQEKLFLFNCNIPEYLQSNHVDQHEPKRPRELLLHKKELAKLLLETQRQGITLVPLMLYFNHRGIVKLSVGLAKGKKQVDKREADKQRDWQREKHRLLKENR